MRGDYPSLLHSVTEVVKIMHSDAVLIDEDVIDDITTVFVFRTEAGLTITVSVGIEQVHIIET
ncbi:hypothetical protein D3C71_234690 [compost metagenome]